MCFFDKNRFYGLLFFMEAARSRGRAMTAAKMLFTMSKGMKGRTPLVMTAPQAFRLRREAVRPHRDK